MSERVWRLVVEVPVAAGEAVCDTIFDAICEAVDSSEPVDRSGWDCFTYAYQTVSDD